MGRSKRVDVGGYVYHVLNRANGRENLFADADDFAAFEKILAQAMDRVPVRLLAYCLMPNHWHLLVWPKHDGDLAKWVRWLTLTHTQRVHAHRHDTGRGHIYQGRYKSFLVSSDTHFLTVARYIERNPVRAKLVEQAEQWRWGSLWRRRHPKLVEDVPTLTDWPVQRPRQWAQRVNQAETSAELESLRGSVNRGRPFGPDRWVANQVKKLGLETTVRPRGRPRKAQTS